ncbi:CHDCT2 domain protein [Ancylostoma caninum]|uniref:CHDCT2 domain protein n=1 Tax=Ancylostoma caninum TaxID=29170 RepID=A0A368G5J2_ANCCA|nr:CHDCT2 domain protein [Ancylostoma caninum]
MWHRKCGGTTTGYLLELFNLGIEDIRIYRWILDLQLSTSLSAKNREKATSMRTKTSSCKDVARFLLERTLVIGERLRRAAYLNLRNSATDGTAQLAQRFADIGNVADSHDNVAKDSAAGNRNANAAVHKVLN